jgi:spoIIIJ-associated protein
MGFEGTVSAKADEQRLDVTVALQSGEELLTGRKGEVRQALQHILNLMINRGRPERYHLQLEINDFWQRREDELRALAQSLAEEALSSGNEAVTEYLNAQERRVVHMTLKGDARVKTYALGTGLIKRVAVAPADYPEGPGGGE